jgi:hypothetical protein
MGRISPTFRQLYEETISDLKTELQGALVDLGHKNAFDLLLKEAWTLPTVCDKLNIMAAIHDRKLIAAIMRELKERDSIIEKLEERIISIENRLNEIKIVLAEDRGI